MFGVRVVAPQLGPSVVAKSVTQNVTVAALAARNRYRARLASVEFGDLPCSFKVTEVFLQPCGIVSAGVHSEDEGQEW